MQLSLFYFFNCNDNGYELHIQDILNKQVQEMFYEWASNYEY